MDFDWSIRINTLLSDSGYHSKVLKNHNNNYSGYDYINNKKIPSKSHKPIISYLVYKHNSPSESIVSQECLEILVDIYVLFKILLRAYPKIIFLCHYLKSNH